MTDQPIGGANPGALEHLTSLTHGERSRLVACAYLLTGRVDVAEDVVHDVVAKLLKANPPNLTNVDAYVKRAIVNECNTRGRRLVRARATQYALHIEVQRLHGTQPDPHLRAEVASALASIPQRDRSALVLRYYLDWTDAEIGDALGCAPATVRSWLSRGLARLREALADNPPAHHKISQGNGK